MSKDINPSELYGWNIYQIARQQDPYVTWADIRSETPVLDAGEGVYLVTSWDLVDRIVRDPQFLAGRGVAESMDTAAGSKIDVASLWLMSMDGPRHVHARGLVRRPFSARKVEELSEFVTDRVRSIIPGFLDDCRARPTDFLEKVAMNVPSEVIRRLLGIDPRVWTEKVHPRFIASVEDSSSSAMEELAAFFEREEASSGLLDALGAPDDDGNQLTREEVIANAVLLAMAAIDTTAGLIANALVCLLQNPHVLPLAQRDPSLISKVVEETLRLEPSALSCSRFAPDAFELGGYSSSRREPSCAEHRCGKPRSSEIRISRRVSTRPRLCWTTDLRRWAAFLSGRLARPDGGSDHSDRIASGALVSRAGDAHQLANGKS